MSITVTVNGQRRDVRMPPETPLLWVLREELGLNGTKYGCGASLCGTCTIHLDGAAIRSCLLPVAACRERNVTTIEGLGPSELEKAFLDEDVSQCGYCQPGMLMTLTALLNRQPEATADEIWARLTNLCRCGTYPRILRALHRVRP